MSSGLKLINVPVSANERHVFRAFCDHINAFQNSRLNTKYRANLKCFYIYDISGDIKEKRRSRAIILIFKKATTKDSDFVGPSGEVCHLKANT